MHTFFINAFVSCRTWVPVYFQSLEFCYCVLVHGHVDLFWGSSFSEIHWEWIPIWYVEGVHLSSWFFFLLILSLSLPEHLFAPHLKTRRIVLLNRVTFMIPVREALIFRRTTENWTLLVEFQGSNGHAFHGYILDKQWILKCSTLLDHFWHILAFKTYFLCFWAAVFCNCFLKFCNWFL